MPQPRPILMIAGGAGGLPTLDAVARRLPGREIDYVADTARGPFAQSDPDTAAGHVAQLIAHFARPAPELVLLASHTLSAACLPLLRERMPHVPLTGVTEPTARAAAAGAGSLHKPTIGVLASPTAIASRAIQAAIGRRRSRASVLLQPVPLLSGMVDEGRACADPLLRTALKQYLRPMLDRRPDVVVLAGGHLSRVRDAVVERVCERSLVEGWECEVVDAVSSTADDVCRRLRERGGGGGDRGGDRAAVRCHVTDGATRFDRLASRLCTFDLPATTRVNVADLPPVMKYDGFQPVPLRRAG